MDFAQKSNFATEPVLLQSATPLPIHTSCTGEGTPPSIVSCREGTTVHGGRISLCVIAYACHRLDHLATRATLRCRQRATDSLRRSYRTSRSSPSLITALSGGNENTCVVSDRHGTLPHGQSARCTSTCARPDRCSTGRYHKAFAPARGRDAPMGSAYVLWHITCTYRRRKTWTDESRPVQTPSL